MKDLTDLMLYNIITYLHPHEYYFFSKTNKYYWNELLVYSTMDRTSLIDILISIVKNNYLPSDNNYTFLKKLLKAIPCSKNTQNLYDLSLRYKYKPLLKAFVEEGIRTETDRCIFPNNYIPPF